MSIGVPLRSTIELSSECEGIPIERNRRRRDRDPRIGEGISLQGAIFVFNQFHAIT